MQPNIAGDGSHIDRAAARLGARASANIIQVHAAAAALGLHTPSDAGGVNVAALGFDLHQADFTRNINGKLSGEMPGPPALPFAHDPTGIPAHVGRELVGLELAFGFLLGRGIRTSMNDVVDVPLRAALND